MAEGNRLTAERLRELMHYEPTTGVFRWRVQGGRGISRHRPGTVAGCTDRTSGYRQFLIDRYRYRAHRLAWLYVTGAWPHDQIDHINRDRSDNRFINLREATQEQNNWNAGLSIHNTSGFKGVSKDRRSGRWEAHISLGNRKKFLGYFDRPEHAANAHRATAIRYRGVFARADDTYAEHI